VKTFFYIYGFWGGEKGEKMGKGKRGKESRGKEENGKGEGKRMEREEGE